MPDLKLPKLPKTDTVRLTITLPHELHERLELYARIYSETYDDPVDLKRLLPHMLERFLASDRGFQRRVARLPKKHQPGRQDHDQAAMSVNEG